MRVQLLIMNLKVVNPGAIVFNDATIIDLLVDVISVQKVEVLGVVELVHVVVIVVNVVREAWVILRIIFWGFLFVHDWGLFVIAYFDLWHHLFLFDFPFLGQDLLLLESFKLLLFYNLVEYRFYVLIPLGLLTLHWRKHRTCPFASSHSTYAWIVDHGIATITIIRNASFWFELHLLYLVKDSFVPV